MNKCTTEAAEVVPISVFVSRKLSKLFVRQGFTPLFDVPVKIQNPGEPLGTHVFSVMELQNDGASIRWTVVSLPEEFPLTSGSSTKERKAPAKGVIETSTPVLSPDSASAALNRIEIPRDGVERISELLTPGSSLTISDYGITVRAISANCPVTGQLRKWVTGRCRSQDHCHRF